MYSEHKRLRVDASTLATRLAGRFDHARPRRVGPISLSGGARPVRPQLTPLAPPAQNGRLAAASPSPVAPPRKGRPLTAPGRMFVASAVVGARFLPVWLATGVLAIVAATIAPRALQNTSWAYVLPYMTILAIAALGQMLVIMHAGIDLSTPGVISLGGNLIVGVSLGQDHRLALGLLACLGLGAGVGLVNGILVGIVRLNPLIVTLAVGQIVLAWSLRYSRENTNSLQVPEALTSWATDKPLGISAVFWTGAAITIAVALALRYTAPGRRFQAVGANPRAAWMAG